MARRFERWWRNRWCRHEMIYLNASTGVEPAPACYRGNAIVGVTVRCHHCDWVGVGDVVAAIPSEALARLERARGGGK